MKDKDMQTDARLSDASYPDNCPVCGRLLTGDSNTCPSCGFIGHESPDLIAHESSRPAPVDRPHAGRRSHPGTPIPARASARRGQSQPAASSSRRKATARSTRKDESRPYKSSHYEVESSLSSLSLIISEVPTVPPRSTRRLEPLDEIDTVPQSSEREQTAQTPASPIPAVEAELPETPLPLTLSAVPNLALVAAETSSPQRFADVEEIDTIPEVYQTPAGTAVPRSSITYDAAADAPSWTATHAATGAPTRRPRHQRGRSFNPLDRTRWWLLRPGHIEFLLWVLGSLLLFAITFLLLLATVLSVMLPGWQTGRNFPSPALQTSPGGPVTTSTAAGGLQLTLAGPTSLSPGSEIHLQGAGFHPRSQVVFLLDDRLPLLDRQGQAAAVQADATGHFTVNIWLGQGPAWPPGSHWLVAHETAGGRQVSIAITLVTAAATAATSTTGYPGAQNTPAPPVSPRPTSTPAPPAPTSVPASPTPSPPDQAPTAVPTTPAPSPTTPPPPANPVPTSTGGATATPVAPGGTSTPSANMTALSNTLTGTGDSSLLARLAHLHPLAWIIGICYFVSLLLLGIAGLLRRP